ncbi:nitric oxide reductase activation protein NorD [Shewanella sp. Choline-02u-19]|uniref:nitric oxide reductase activation protein NorD n=1 Tax=unclassified Shewanella TaxID=196818 RepID=UPI000C331875|nr:MULTISPECIES: VWA domain-containing protein [unclassified Shewanella]PKH54601.1 nitric oxide reductase activation protein NorD [Shewanella sp. Bg11-22]PKI28659.1 nitric oxide reductase activation protein NorD [Shewanella sp. Choline-02u-19]
MEEWVGSIWHKFIVQKSNTEFDHARVQFDDINKSVGVIFRALGGSPTKRVEAAIPRDYYAHRKFIDKISGAKQQVSLAWQDETSLRLPQSIAIFDTPELNKELYLWLAALAPHYPEQFTHWARDNQTVVAKVLCKYPAIRPRYQRLVAAILKQRVPIEALPKSLQPLERAVIQAITHPESIIEFPVAHYAPQAIYIWLYPNENVKANPFSAADIDCEEEQGSSAAKKQQSVKARKKSERIEEDDTKDSLMVFRLENLFSWSEFSRVNRAEDDTEDDDAQRVAEDLDIITVAKGSKQKTAKLKIDLDLPAAIEDDLPLGKGITLPEWNYKSNLLVADRCLLQPMLPRDSKPLALPSSLHSAAKKIRQQFQQLQSIKNWQKSQPSGDEIDLTAWLDFHIESQTSMAQDTGLYRSFQRCQRDISCLLLSDLSMSTDAYINNELRVIDVIKDSMLLFSEALAAVGDPFALYGFSSVKRHHVRFTLLKNFSESYNDHIRGRILSLRPGFYTRMGAAIRQASNILAEQTHHRKLLLILTDGKPNDIDNYEGRYGIEDTKQAIIAARRLGLIPFCITIDQKADQYLPYIFGHNGFSVIFDPSQLPTKLPQLYHQLTQSSY